MIEMIDPAIPNINTMRINSNMTLICHSLVSPLYSFVYKIKTLSDQHFLLDQIKEFGYQMVLHIIPKSKKGIKRVTLTKVKLYLHAHQLYICIYDKLRRNAYG